MGRRKTSLAKRLSRGVVKVSKASERARQGFHKTAFDTDIYKNPVMGSKKSSRKRGK